MPLSLVIFIMVMALVALFNILRLVLYNMGVLVLMLTSIIAIVTLTVESLLFAYGAIIILLFFEEVKI